MTQKTKVKELFQEDMTIRGTQDYVPPSEDMTIRGTQDYVPPSEDMWTAGKV